MRTVMISGGNKGLGFATSRLLGRKGLRVWLGSRSADAGEAAAGTLRSEGCDVTAIQLDITDEASVIAATARINAETGLDILINNAAIMDEGGGADSAVPPPSHVPVDALTRTYATNVLGTLRLTQSLMPVLRRSVSPRIVNVSSRLGSFGHQSDPDWPGRAVNKLGYSSSKAALNMATLMLAYELRDTPFKVNAVSPGIIATDLNGEGANALRGRPGFARPETGAELIAHYALLPDDGPSGGFFGPGGALAW